jgi:acetyl-CoA carboxylase carboxyl transferase subunit alpha
MRITARDLLDLKIINGIIPEPLGGAHRGGEKVIRETGEQIEKAFKELAASTTDYREHRREKFLAMGRHL